MIYLKENVIMWNGDPREFLNVITHKWKRNHLMKKKCLIMSEVSDNESKLTGLSIHFFVFIFYFVSLLF